MEDAVYLSVLVAFISTFFITPRWSAKNIRIWSVNTECGIL